MLGYHQRAESFERDSSRDCLQSLLREIQSVAIVSIPHRPSTQQARRAVGLINLLSALKVKPVYLSSVQSFSGARLQSSGAEAILMQGAEELGDRDWEHQLFRESLLLHYKSYPLIQLPIAVHFEMDLHRLNFELLAKGHPAFHLLVRPESQPFSELRISSVSFCPDLSVWSDNPNATQSQRKPEKVPTILLGPARHMLHRFGVAHRLEQKLFVRILETRSQGFDPAAKGFSNFVLTIIRTILAWMEIPIVGFRLTWRVLRHLLSVRPARFYQMLRAAWDCNWEAGEPIDGSRAFTAVWFSYAPDYQLVMRSIASLLRYSTQHSFNLLLVQDPAKPFSENQIRDLRSLTGGKLIVWTGRWKVAHGELSSLAAELTVFRKISTQSSGGHKILKLDSDVLIVSDECLKRMSEDTADMWGHPLQALYPRAPLNYIQGGIYSISSGVFRKLSLTVLCWTALKAALFRLQLPKVFHEDVFFSFLTKSTGGKLRYLLCQYNLEHRSRTPQIMEKAYPDLPSCFSAIHYEGNVSKVYLASLGLEQLPSDIL